MTAPMPAALALLMPALLMFGAPCGAQGDPGKELFVTGASPACAICHALKDAGATGAVGPSLDELKPDAQRVKQAVKNGIGQMPAYSSLSDQQIDAVARYIERVAR